MPLGGAGPLLIQWDTTDHPAARLPDDGYSLVRLDLTHPDPERVRQLLAAIGFAGPVIVTAGERVELAAVIQTPTGPRRLAGVVLGV